MENDLADKLDELIMAFDDDGGSSNDGLTVLGADLDTLVSVVAAWIVIGGLVFALASYIGRGSGSSIEETVEKDDARTSSEVDSTTRPSGNGAAVSSAPAKRTASPQSTAIPTAAVSNGFSRSSASPQPTPKIPPLSPKTRGQIVKIGDASSPPVSLGSDPETVAWVNTCLAGMWGCGGSSDPVQLLKDMWREAFNEFCKGAAEVRQ